MPDPVEFKAGDRIKCQIVEQGVDLDKFNDKNLPTDVHIVTYSYADGEKIFDAVRAYTMVDIFDAYHDKLKGKGTVHSIKAGFGRIRPNLYGKIKADE